MIILHLDLYPDAYHAISTIFLSFIQTVNHFHKSIYHRLNLVNMRTFHLSDPLETRQNMGSQTCQFLQRNEYSRWGGKACPWHIFLSKNRQVRDPIFSWLSFQRIQMKNRNAWHWEKDPILSLTFKKIKFPQLDWWMKYDVLDWEQEF